MRGYDLDEKVGLFGLFGIKSVVKLLKQGDSVELKHYSSFDPILADVLEVSESKVKVEAKHKVANINVFPKDHVVLNYSSSEIYTISGEIESIEELDPLNVIIKVGKIERLKDQRSSERFTVNLPATVKIIGVPDAKFAIVKNISLGGVKVNCQEDIMLEDMVDVVVRLDKNMKMNFKGRVVRKNKHPDFFEYGIEMSEVGESNMRSLHYFINKFTYGH